jgi:hypothetical protein
VKDKCKEIGLMLVILTKYNAVSSNKMTQLYANHGHLENMAIMEGKGFGYFEMARHAKSETAKEKLYGDILRCPLKMNEAKSRSNSLRMIVSRRY